MHPFIWAWGQGSVACLLGFVIASFFFTDAILTAATGFTCFGLIFLVTRFLEQNRDAIWIEHQSSWRANSVLTLEVVAVFVGVFWVSLFCQQFFPSWFYIPATYKKPLFNNHITPLFLSNLRVLFGSFFLAVIYRAPGLILVLCWNAINWSTTILNFMYLVEQTHAVNTLFYTVAILPHLVLEAAAYITSGMSGVFMAKAIFKYKLSSARFFKVSRASLMILTAAVLLLWLATLLEVGLAQSVLKQLQHSSS